MTATNFNKFRLARCLLYTIFPQDTYSLPVYIPQMPVYVAGQEVFLADRALCLTETLGGLGRVSSVLVSSGLGPNLDKTRNYELNLMVMMMMMMMMMIK